jgi:hypothetical protein
MPKSSAQLGVARCASGDNLAGARIFDTQVRRLHQKATDDFLDIEFVALDGLGMEASCASLRRNSMTSAG